MLVIDSNTQAFTTLAVTAQILQCYCCYSEAAAGCRAAVCEAQYVVGPVIRHMDPSLPHAHTQRSVVTQLPLSGQPLQPHHFPSLGGMTDAGSRERRRKGDGLPLVAPQMWPVCLSSWNVLYSRRIERCLDKQGGCVYVS